MCCGQCEEMHYTVRYAVDIEGRSYTVDGTHIICYVDRAIKRAGDGELAWEQDTPRLKIDTQCEILSAALTVSRAVSGKSTHILYLSKSINSAM